MIKIIKHEPAEEHAYLVQSVPTCEVTLLELEQYAEDGNISVDFDGELTHIIKLLF